MKVLILGGTGMLGHKLVQVLGRELEIAATFRRWPAGAPYADLFASVKAYHPVFAGDLDAVRYAVDDFRPDVVINAIGVIKQLAESQDVVTSLSINSLFPQHLSVMAAERGFRLIQISTDCVFDGKRGMYAEADVPNAADLYGQSKRWGEVAGPNCVTLRTSIVGRELDTAHSLVDWFLSNRGGTVKGYRNAIYSGFPTIVFADILRDLILSHQEISGLFQISSEPINKFDLLRLINERFNAGITIEPFDDFSIDRSLDSTRFRAATGFRPLSWPEMIDRMAADPTPYHEWNQLHH